MLNREGVVKHLPFFASWQEDFMKQEKYRIHREERGNMTRNAEWEKAETFINDIPRFTKKNTLQNTRGWYESLGCPGSSAKVIHVAGTNGKGSVCNYLGHLLTADGLKVGMFTSPHLISMNERIMINGEIIDKTCFLKAYDRMRESIDNEMGIVNLNRKDDQNKRPDRYDDVRLFHPTFFEFLFLLAMLVFEEKKVEVIILETGLGGRLDATNIFHEPWLTIITEIGLDHMMYLGDTISQMAGEKAGIIKPGVPVVFADRCRETTDVILQRARELQAPYYAVGPEDGIIQKIRNKSIDFSYKSSYYDYVTFTLPTKALYQVENAALALRGYELLMGEAWDTQKAGEVLAVTNWAGRMEEIRSDVYVDGAHNEDGIRAFLETVCRMKDDKKNTLVFSAVQDKAYEKMIDSVVQAGIFDRFVVVHMPQERSVSQSELQRIFGKYENLEVFFAESIDAALTASVGQKKMDERVYIAGSLYLVGYVLAALGRKLKDD